MVLDTGSTVNVIRSDALPRKWERARVSPVDGPKLTDANGKPISIACAVRLTVQLGAKTSQEKFYVAPNLVVPVFLGTSYLNSHVNAIKCRQGLVELQDGGTIAIPNRRNSPHLSTTLPDRSLAPNKVKLTSGVVVPPRTQLCVSVIMEVSGLCCLESSV